MIPDFTARTDRGAVDLVPFLRRDAGQVGVQMRDWERAPAALALTRLGWTPERVSHAVGLSTTRIRELLDGQRDARTRPLRQSDESDRARRNRARRLAQRVEVDGRLIHPFAPRHGRNSTYHGYGCRCGPCSRAHTEAHAESRRRTA